MSGTSERSKLQRGCLSWGRLHMQICPAPSRACVQNVQALRLGGVALLEQAICLVDSDKRQAKQLLKVRSRPFFSC